MGIELQKKISVAKCFGKVTATRVAKAGGKLTLGRIFGSASGTKSGVSDFGEWTALTGEFRAVSEDTGETFDSAVCFMPDVAQNLILAQLAAGAAAVDFAFDILAVADESVAIGFTYRALPVIESTENSAIARIEAKMLAMLPDKTAETGKEKETASK